MSKFCERLKELRGKAGLSQQELANVMNISKSSINMYERGEREPGLEAVRKFADFFDVQTDYLLGKHDDGRSVKEGEKYRRLILEKTESFRKRHNLTKAQLEKLLDWKDMYDVLENGRMLMSEVFLTAIEMAINTFETPINGKTFDENLRDMGLEEDQSLKPQANAIFLSEKNVHMIPLFEGASAGFGTNADGSIVGYVPLYIESESEAQETLCITVRGDSMYPKIEDGDIIQVRKQESVDSGSLAVVLLDGEEGLVKKVVYGEDWIELHSINPMYQTMRFEKAEVLRLRVVGLVRKIIKNV